MAFVAEDGTGKADANSFIDAAYADAYFADRGVAEWVGTPEEKQQYLIRATDYISNRFRFKGERDFDAQALEFPRTFGEEFTGMPENLLKATAEYALRAKSAALAPDPTVDASGLQVAGTRVKVGPIERETSYQQGVSPRLFKPYPAADMLLRDLIVSAARVIRG